MVAAEAEAAREGEEDAGEGEEAEVEDAAAAAAMPAERSSCTRVRRASRGLRSRDLVLQVYGSTGGVGQQLRYAIHWHGVHGISMEHKELGSVGWAAVKRCRVLARLAWRGMCSKIKTA